MSKILLEKNPISHQISYLPNVYRKFNDKIVGTNFKDYMYLVLTKLAKSSHTQIKVDYHNSIK